MKKITFLLPLVMMFLSCDHHVLDGKFYESKYEYDYGELRLERGKKINPEDLFAMNYSITAHRDYYGYDIKGVKYIDLIKQAKEMREHGHGVIQKFDEAPPMPEGLDVKITNVKETRLQSEKKASRSYKALRFSAVYTNRTSKPIAHNYSTFLLKGPIGDHLITLAYERNCRIPANGSLTISYAVKGTDIRSSILFGKSNGIKRIMADDLFKNDNMKIEIGGIMIDPEAEFYSTCRNEYRPSLPFYQNTQKKIYPNGIKVEEIDGKPTVHLGPRFYTREDVAKLEN